MIIDLRTVFLIYVIANALCVMVMTSLWLHNRKRFPGITLWLIDFVLQFIAVLLVLLRGTVPDFASMVLANTFVVGGTVALYIGLERFVGKQSSQMHNYAMIGVFMIVHAYLTYGYPNLPLRNINLSSGLLFICVQASWLMLRKVEPQMRSATRATGIVLAIFCLVSAVRIPANIISWKDDVTVNLFQSGVFNAIILVIYLVLFIALTFALFILVNRRLSAELENELVDHQKTEDELRKRGKSIRAITDSANDAIIMMDNDGNISYWNPAAEHILGYKREEVIGLNLHDLLTPERFLPSYRAAYPEFQKTGKGNAIGKTLELAALRKDGKEIDITLSLSAVNIKGAWYAVGIIQDISERKLSHELIRLRLSLFEFATKHSLDELLQKTLDEVGVLVNSPIAFYHFLEEDQNTLSLQAWSTRTLNEFCKTEGKGMHYEIDQAGVWVDCVRERKAVVHNDYNSLPNRKGLPKGHAAVIRELVVPIMRGGNIVAILGVGNKPVEYTQKDIEIVSYLADVAWEIAERKKAEEERNKYSIDLRERMKELKCLYSVSEIVRREDISQEEILKLCPDIISQAYQFPEITACRIIWGDHEYKTENFRKTEWSQSFDIMVNSQKAGSIEVDCIGGKNQECYDDFFLAEERNLLKNITELLGRSAERKQAEEQIKHLATHDPLTDLPTLRLVEDRLAMAMELAKRHKKKTAVLFIDLDGFKNVNDTLGHDAGDYLLKTLAQHFLTCIRKTDTISRIGGDEFLLVAGELKSVDDATKIAQKVLKLVSRPVQIEGQKLSVSASIGIAFYPDHGEDIKELIRLADEAMYRVKNSGKNGFAFADQTIK
jgi:diguanylate cyclase (GGDEF)-like protein/PAS domain S-box-containing protein